MMTLPKLHTLDNHADESSARGLTICFVVSDLSGDLTVVRQAVAVTKADASSFIGGHNLTIGQHAVDKPEVVDVALISWRELASQPRESTAIDLIVVWQDWPDQWGQGDVAALMAHYPIARLVVAYSPWCASDGRTRDDWPLAIRVPQSELSHRLQLELEVLAGRRPPLERTASRAELFAFLASEP